MPEFLDMLLNIDQYPSIWVSEYGVWIYLILFLIVFGETGLVVLPFLPGDSLLFMAGAFSATGVMNPVILGILLFNAAVLGNTVNYSIGRYIGPKVYERNYKF